MSHCDGRVEAGFFLLDVFCLGVKDAGFELFSSYEEFHYTVAQTTSIPCHIEPPGADYKKASRVFGGISKWHSFFVEDRRSDSPEFDIDVGYERNSASRRSRKRRSGSCCVRASARLYDMRASAILPNRRQRSARAA